LLPFATGNWGCGVFGGDPQYKFLLQWLVASQVGRPLVYAPFDDHRMRGMEALVAELQRYSAESAEAGREFSLWVLYRWLLEYATYQRSRESEDEQLSVFEILEDRIQQRQAPLLDESDS